MAPCSPTARFRRPPREKARRAQRVDSMGRRRATPAPDTTLTGKLNSFFVYALFLLALDYHFPIVDFFTFMILAHIKQGL